MSPRSSPNSSWLLSYGVLSALAVSIAKLVTFVGGTCGSVNARALSQNLKELQVIGSKHDTIRKGLVYELLSAQDKVLCSYYAQRGGQRHQPRHQGMSLDDLLTKLS